MKIITTYDVVYRFFVMGLMPTVMKRGGLIGQALTQITAAGTMGLVTSGVTKVGKVGLSVGDGVKKTAEKIATGDLIGLGDGLKHGMHGMMKARKRTQLNLAGGGVAQSRQQRTSRMGAEVEHEEQHREAKRRVFPHGAQKKASSRQRG